MYDQSPYLFIHIGLMIRLLRHAQDFSIRTITKEGETLGRQLETVNFAVSSEGLNELTAFLSQLKQEDKQDRKITAYEVKELSEFMSVVEKIVFAEAQTKKIYILTESRFNLDNLTNNPEQMFAKGAFSRLSRLTAYDVREGFMCIVLSRATAAAFHLLRATEGTLRDYYFNIVKRGRAKKPMWGNMIQHLRSRRKPDESLLQRLDYIRDTYRNPTSHPEARHTIEQAQDLLGLCIDVINVMAKALPEPKGLFRG